MFSSLFLVILVSFIFFFVSYKMIMDSESSSVYECGFDISSGARGNFSYRFFLIAVLFLIFDVEIVLMLPAPMMILGFFFFFFLLVLVMGLVYEFYCGSLEWL